MATLTLMIDKLFPDSHRPGRKNISVVSGLGKRQEQGIILLQFAYPCPE
ncbi:hypothetical protein [Nodularia sp. NIES-3585]|nr:hypothetical protein [Nodularia sp. NIES-3585]